MLKLTDISLSSRLSGINVSASKGKLIHLIGPNGAGKSTLLAVMAGLLTYQGKAELAGRDIARCSGLQLARLRGYLSQQQENASMMQVFQYIALHQPQNASVEATEQTVAFLAERLDLADKLSRPLTKLSGGEWQRVRLAAIFLQVWPTLNSESQLLLLDEPMNNLDVAQQAALDGLLMQFCAEGRTAIVSAHNLNHTLHHADEAWLLHDGSLMTAGVTAEVMKPKTLENVFNIGFELFQTNSLSWLIPVEKNSID
ncbi:vitamin B12 ABC transporter ATP-binding protein BtuD [Pragia fontium]|uniref:Vitamin B12 import ATP-binding protein BtuD n=2 Tax=Pragia fontium TaxID=82985 RepID=A0AAJ5BGM7_9GAMM|nr:vitamin B12 ABC transporter ATP-binding protein BtuD [Pragia fontium]GKX61869.1 vitamin B12 import ATP-binding protein BtuD [Pragia fontium]SFC50348.1 vitamin B12 transport system ATP-binding protein [Pragia fontium DSM 5563 = ATCC 49100]SUB82336.1 Vitamin B12 import ATP-binding protein BtuD [Pragia fontium]VEJ55196.1 Vitamin B12 import ATP-binding protein BtuD [Pragia fontium]